MATESGQFAPNPATLDAARSRIDAYGGPRLSRFIVVDFDRYGLRAHAYPGVGAPPAEANVPVAFRADAHITPTRLDLDLAEHMVHAGKVPDGVATADLIAAMALARGRLLAHPSTFVIGPEPVGLLKLSRDDTDEAWGAAIAAARRLSDGLVTYLDQDLTPVVFTANHLMWPGLVETIGAQQKVAVLTIPGAGDPAPLVSPSGRHAIISHPSDDYVEPAAPPPDPQLDALIAGGPQAFSEFGAVPHLDQPDRPDQTGRRRRWAPPEPDEETTGPLPLYDPASGKVSVPTADADADALAATSPPVPPARPPSELEITQQIPRVDAAREPLVVAAQVPREPDAGVTTDPLAVRRPPSVAPPRQSAPVAAPAGAPYRASVPAASPALPSGSETHGTRGLHLRHQPPPSGHHEAPEPREAADTGHIRAVRHRQNRRVMLAAIVVALLVVAGAVAFAQPWNEQPERRDRYTNQVLGATQSNTDIAATTTSPLPEFSVGGAAAPLHRYTEPPPPPEPETTVAPAPAPQPKPKPKPKPPRRRR